jgi:hypothetical protein
MKAIITKYHPWTNTKPARLSASTWDGNRIYVSLTHIAHSADSEEAHRVAAQTLADKMKWEGRLVGGGIKGGYAFVFVD